MSPIRLADIKIHHIIDSTKDYSTFAAAREHGSNKIRIFLVKDSGVYAHNGQADTWKELVGSVAAEIRHCISRDRDYVPVYKVSSVYTN
jgi:hypothetical protein